MEININEGGMPVDRSAPTEKEIKLYEESFSIKLPLDYIKLLNYSNGGHPQLDSFVPVGHSENNRWAIDTFYYLSESNKDDHNNIWRVTKEWRNYIGIENIPIGRDAGGNQIFIDNSSNGSVFLCIHDENFKKVEIAKSLNHFIDLLEEDPDMI